MIVEAFSNAQKTTACHKKYIQSLRRGKCSQDPDVFRAEFLRCLNSALLVFKREPSVERLVAFTAKFCSAADENGQLDCDFANQLMRHLLIHTSSRDKAVRLRTCQLIAAILGSAGDRLEVEEDLWVEASEQILARCRDKVPAVRAASALALSFFQDPDDPDDEAITELARLMATDTSKDVRKTALQHIAVTPSTLPRLLSRIHDTRPDVRKLLFQVIAWKLPIKKLTVGQRCQILEAGLDERTPLVREACIDLICNTWLLDVAGSEPFKLLSWLDVESHEHLVVNVLSVIFARCSRTRQQCASVQASLWDAAAHDKLASAAAGEDGSCLAPEVAVYLRVRCQWAKTQTKIDCDNILDRLILNLSTMCELVNYHYQQCRHTGATEPATIHGTDLFISRQLLSCIEMADFADEAGRGHVVDLLRRIIGDIASPNGILNTAFRCLQVASIDEDAYVRMVVEQIMEMQDPLQQRNEADWMERTWLRCLGMASILLKSTHKSMTCGEVESLEDSLLLPAVQHSNALVRDHGVLALGQYCLLDKRVATRYLILFLQAIRNDMDAVQLTGLKVLFDVLFVFDISGQEGGRQMQATAVETILPYLSHTDPEFRTTAVEGIAKLLLGNRVADPKLLSRLLILLYTPTCEEDSRLRQCLSMFFPAYAFSSPHHRLCIEACFLPTLRICVHAPKSSPLRLINVADMAEYALNLTNVDAQPDFGLSIDANTGTAAEHAMGIHERLGVVLLNEILSDSDAVETRIFCKTLLLLNICPISTQADGHTNAICTLQLLTANASKMVGNRFAKTSLHKFQINLARLDAVDTAKITDDQQEAILDSTRSHIARRQDEIAAITEALSNAV